MTINADLDLAFVIPVQQGGHDLIRDASAPFGKDQIPLIIWKIRQLKNFVMPEKIYVSTHSEKIKKLVKREGIKIHNRKKSLEEESLGPIGEVIASVVFDIPHEYIAWVSPVVPFMGEYDYKKAIVEYKTKVIDGEFDGLMAVNMKSNYYWDDKGPINYNADKNQELRTELSKIYRVTNGLFINSKENILQRHYYVGLNPYKFEVSALAGLDINAEEDYDVAETLSSLYTKRKSERDNVVFLDFDGVVFDSVIEAYAIAMLTAQRIKKLSELDINTEHATRFIKQRYLIGPAWNYFYLLRAIDDGNDDRFSDYLPDESGDDAKNFQSSFFATRQVIRNNFWDEWLHLNKLYDGSEKFIDLINENKNIVIVTTKDAETVKALLDCHGLKRHIDIYDAKSYESFGCKSYFIDDYIKRNDIQKAVFIDDSVKHLDKCKWVNNLELQQACWGYVSEDEYHDNKIEVIDKINKTLRG